MKKHLVNITLHVVASFGTGFLGSNLIGITDLKSLELAAIAGGLAAAAYLYAVCQAYLNGQPLPETKAPNAQ